MKSEGGRADRFVNEMREIGDPFEKRLVISIPLFVLSLLLMCHLVGRKV